jgi:uncharacterized membrane protein (UPF0127 family)
MSTRALLLLALALAACRHAPPSPGAGPITGSQRHAAWRVAPAPAVETAQVVCVNPLGQRVTVRAEVVRTEADRARGLMFRRELAPDAGMLFVMPADDRWKFWMKNTLLPLDMLFADGAGQVLGVVANARPMDESPLGVDAPSRYVLEVNAHFAREHGLGAGSRLEMPTSVTSPGR